jgi:hypothetical protein
MVDLSESFGMSAWDLKPIVRDALRRALLALGPSRGLFSLRAAMLFFATLVVLFIATAVDLNEFFGMSAWVLKPIVRDAFRRALSAIGPSRGLFSFRAAMLLVERVGRAR